MSSPTPVSYVSPVPGPTPDLPRASLLFPLRLMSGAPTVYYHTSPGFSRLTTVDVELWTETGNDGTGATR